MNKKEFTDDELYEKMKYIVYCIAVDIDFKSCSSNSSYQEFLKTTDKHCGDCTKEPQTCNRCFLHSIEIKAQNIVNILMSKDIGYCGKKCIEECNYKEKEND